MNNSGKCRTSDPYTVISSNCGQIRQKTGDSELTHNKAFGVELHQIGKGEKHYPEAGSGTLFQEPPFFGDVVEVRGHDGTHEFAIDDFWK